MAGAVKKVRVSKASKPVPTKFDVESSESSGSSEPSDGSESSSDFSSESEGDFEIGESDLNDEFLNDSEESSDDNDEAPAKNEVSKFDNAMAAILGSKIKAHDRENPVLIRNKRMAKEIESAKLESQARRQLRLEKLQSQDKSRVKNIIPTDPDEAGRVLQREKRYKKTAQRGVVRLMNALRASQSAANTAFANSSSFGVDKKTQEVTTASKDSFLDMIRSG